MLLRLERAGKHRTQRVVLILGLAILLLGLSLPAALQLFNSHNTPASPPTLSSNLAGLPLSFEPNAGQTDPSVRFTVHGRKSTLFFAQSEVVLAFASSVPKGGAKSDRAVGSARAQLMAQTEGRLGPSTLRLRFIGSNPIATVEQGNSLPGKVNYLIGKDPAQWHTGVPTYDGITYSRLYPGIDLQYTGADGRLKGTYTLSPGADPSLIKWRYDGADTPTIDEQGNLIVTLNSDLDPQSSVLTEAAPVAWQEIGGQRVGISSSYVVQADGSIGFELGEYDHAQPLTIDPTLIYSTYLGGFYGDGASGIALDTARNIYISGTTRSSDFPTTSGAFQTVYGGDEYDMFASKLSADGSTLIYSTFLGGDGWDVSGFVAVDAQGKATVGGWTTSDNFPTTPGAFQTVFEPNYDVAVAKLNADGSSLVFGTYWGGGVLEPYGFAVDGAGNTYFTGYFYSHPDSYVFVGGLSSDGSQEVVYKELGGNIPGPGDENSNSSGEGITLDASGNIYVTGYTRAADFPVTSGAYRTFLQAYEDGFLTKLDPTGHTILYSTFIPGGGSDYPYDVAVDATGNAYLTGWTGSSDYPTTPGAFQTVKGDPTIAFVTKFNATASALVYSTYLGDTQFHFDTADYGFAIRVNNAGNAYVTGYTSSPGFPVHNPLQAALRGDSDAFVTKFNPTGSALDFSTYLGGTGGESASGLVLDASGLMHVAGGSSSTDFPLVNPLQPTNHGSGDAFVAVISEANITPTPTRTGTPPTGTPTACAPGPSAWRAEPTMTIGRDYASAAVVDNKLYVIGGSHTGMEPPYIAVVERFDPATATWDTVAPVPVAAESMAATSLGNKIYLAGGFTVRQGFTLDLMQIYDASTNSWSQGSRLPQRTTAAAAATYNGKIYIFGGGYMTSWNSVYEYDPVADTYTPKAPMPTTESQIAAATVGDRIYVVGGYRHDQYTHYVYDPIANTWSTIATPLTPSFAWAGAFALNGELWVEGGYDNFTQQGYPPSQEVHIYNPATNSWRFGPAFNTPRTRSRAVGVINGRGYVAGGADLLDEDVLLTSLESISYSGCNTATPVPTSAATTTTPPLPTAPPNVWPGAQWVSGCVPAILNITTHSDITPPDRCIGPSIMRLTNRDGEYVEREVPAMCETNNQSYTISIVIGNSVPYTWINFQPFTLTVDYYNQIIESDETDNTMQLPFSPPCGSPTVSPTRTPLLPTSTSTPTTTTTPTPCAIVFTDVPPDHTFYPFIRCMACRGIINGYTSGCESGNPCFRPQNLVTRGQIAKIVSNSAGWDEIILFEQQTFEDVQAGNTFWVFIERMVAHGVIQGYPCGVMAEPCIPPKNRPYFRPGNNVTRGQTAKIVSEAAGYTDTPGAQQFEDVVPGSTFYAWIWRITNRGIMSGYPCGGIAEPCVPPDNRPYFRPGNNATRGQAAKIVSNTFLPNCVTPSARK